jgi:hypothetical protein
MEPQPMTTVDDTPSFKPPPLPIVGPKNGFGFDGSNEVYKNKDAAKNAAFENGLDALIDAISKDDSRDAFYHTRLLDSGQEEVLVVSVEAIKKHRRPFLNVLKLLNGNDTPSVIATSTGVG